MISFFKKVVCGIFKSRYSVESKSSSVQLFDDFGAFPPSPLSGEKLNVKFSIVGVQGVGRICQEIRETRLLVRTLTLDADLMSSEAQAYFGSLDLKLLSSTIAKMGRFRRMGEFFFLALILGWKLALLTNGKVRARRRKDYLGYFFPISTGSMMIVVRSDIQRCERKVAVITHEHIHLLQSLSAEKHSRKVRSPERFLVKSKVSDPYLLYLLEKKEVEARLHEVVLSFYRAHGQLPITLQGFFGLLVSNDLCGDYIELLLKFSGVSFDQYEFYSTRDVGFVTDLRSIWVYIDTTENQCRFITEALSVMYGNLLRYYGDEKTSEEFLREIYRPNFYDQLYGVDG